MPTPRLNIILFALYLVASGAILVGALISPPLRSIAYAPLRELVLPPPSPIILPVLYSTEKDAWLTEAVSEFNQEGYSVAGRPIQIEMEKMGSREIYLAVLDGTRQPVLISPAGSLQISILQDLSTSAFGIPLVNQADQTACRPVVRTPLVLVAWRERADTLWGGDPGSTLWDDLHAAITDPQGWGAFGHPEWGYLKFGHTDPLRSNSGFMTILLLAYDYFDRISGLTATELLSDQDFQSWFLGFEQSISQFEYSTGPLMDKMVAYGPSTYDIVAVYEATAIEQAENAVGRYGELRIYYPPATVWADHPFCILNAAWVAPEQAEAARVFIDFLLSQPMQELALIKYGFRPVDSTVPLGQPGSPFNRFTANGLRDDLDGLPVVEVPPGDVLNVMLEFWTRNIQR
jgi:hypothetical protein